MKLLEWIFCISKMNNKNHNNFSFPFHAGNMKMREYRFWLQKGLKMRKQYHFWKPWTWIISEFQSYFLRQFTLDGSTATIYFTLAFYTEKLKKSQISFLVTKSGQNSKVISLLKNLDVNYIRIPPLFFASTHFGRIYS